VWLFIHDLTRGFDLAAEVRVPNRFLADEIDAPLKQLFQRLGKVQKAVRVAARRLSALHLNEKIEIASLRLETVVGRGPENVQAPHVETAAKVRKYASALLNE
jgi:hypothetical protein